MGTSLKVAPFSTLVDLVKKDVPTFLLNLVDSFKSVDSVSKPPSSADAPVQIQEV